MAEGTDVACKNVGDTDIDEEDDVAQGSEPGASQHLCVLPTDSYEDIAAFLDSDSVDDRRRKVSQGTIQTLTSTDREVDSDGRSGAVRADRNPQLKPPDPIIARIDTPTSLASADDEPDSRPATTTEEQNESSSEGVSRTAVDDAANSLNGVHISSDKMTQSTAGEPDDIAAAVDWRSAEWRRHKLHVFILSLAGKPIYSRYGDEDRQATLMGAMQALVSFVQLHDDKSSDTLRCICAGAHRFTFLTREHLILVAASSTRASSHSLFLALTYTYNQIISILTYRRMEQIFSARKNYDLRRLLGGVDRFIDCLLDALETDPCYYLGAVRCLPLEASIRDLVAQTIAQHVKVKDLVFGILIANGQLITLVRLKKCFLYPMDLHMIFNLISASDSFKHAESWTPICLPKFDSSGYLYAHISYLDDSCHTCLMLLTVDKDLFFKLSECKEKIKEKLLRCGCCKAITEALARPNYRMSDVGIAEIWHFMYKSRSTSQLTAPDYTAPYSIAEERTRLFAVYQMVHDRMHVASRPLKILFHVGKFESILGWITSGFELYAVFSPLTSKQLAIASINRLLRWIKKEEERLFILNSPTI